MTSICVFNKKGGPGKTTSTINLAGCLSFFRDKKVLVVDCDSQANATSYLFDGSEEDGPRYTLKDYYEGTVKDVKDLICHFTFKKRYFGDCCPIDLIPGDEEIDAVDIPSITTLREMLEPLDYDFVFFDCPPATNDSTYSALTASDYVIVPALPDPDSLKGYNLLVDLVNNVRAEGYPLEIMGIFFNSVFNQRSLDKMIREQTMASMSPKAFFQHSVRNSAEIAQARYLGVPVCIYDTSSLITLDYRLLADEIIEKAGQKKNN